MVANDVDLRIGALEPGLDCPVQIQDLREHPATPKQQAVAARRLELLRRSGTSGQPATVTLHLILEQHAPQGTFDEFGRAHLTCRECRPASRDAAEQYPCPTAQRVIWAFEASLF